MKTHDFNPDTDLLLERVVPVARERVWRAWTEPKHLMPWFCPRPWSVVACEIDLRPGGAFCTTMRSPDGEEFPNSGCYLDVVPGERLVWTDALSAGFRPSDRGYLTNDGGFYVTVILTLESVEDPATGAPATRYTALAKHASSAARDQHAAMGFHEGWGTALDQLIVYCQSEM